MHGYDACVRRHPHCTLPPPPCAVLVPSQDGSGFIDFRELTCCLSTLCRGSLEDRLRLCFEAYDSDTSGALDSTELQMLARAVLKSADWGGGGGCKEGEEVPQAQAQARAVRCEAFQARLRLMDRNGDGRVTWAEFSAGVQADSSLLRCFGFGGTSDEEGNASADSIALAVSRRGKDKDTAAAGEGKAAGVDAAAVNAVNKADESPPCGALDAGAHSDTVEQPAASEDRSPEVAASVMQCGGAAPARRPTLMAIEALDAAAAATVADVAAGMVAAVEAHLQWLTVAVPGDFGL